VNSFPLSVNILAILIGQAPSRDIALQCPAGQRVQIPQEPARIRGGLGGHNAHKDPACCAPLGVQARLPGNGSIATNR
jgi:hypothetical protein